MPITHLKREYQQIARCKYLKFQINKYVYIYWKYKLQISKQEKLILQN